GIVHVVAGPNQIVDSIIALAVGPDDTIFFSAGNRVRAIDKAGVIHLIAGTGVCGHTGDGGPAIQAQLCNPYLLTAAPDGTLYVIDSSNNCVRRVASDGTISTAAGTCPIGGFSGDNGPATAARLLNPQGIAVGTDGALYIADAGNRRVRRVGVDGVIKTIAGTGAFGHS